jgi:hypothetical protein
VVPSGQRAKGRVCKSTCLPSSSTSERDPGSRNLLAGNGMPRVTGWTDGQLRLLWIRRGTDKVDGDFGGCPGWDGPLCLAPENSRTAFIVIR